MRDARVSVLVPCHNAAPWLADALRSALAQDWPALDVIVVDDGSTDESATIAEGFHAEGVRLIRQARGGASAARNKAIAASHGDFLQFLDADDLLAPGKIRAQVERLFAAPAGSVASGAWARFERDPAQARFASMPNWRDMCGPEFLWLHYEEHCMVHPAAWLVPRGVAEKVGPWDESLTLNDDGEYFARVALASEGILFCPTARSYYRSSIGGLSSRRDPAALDSLFRSFDLMVGALLDADSSHRSVAAAAHAWKWLAFELYPEAAQLSREAERRSRSLGGSQRALPRGGRQALLSRIIGWRLAKRFSLARRG